MIINLARSQPFRIWLLTFALCAISIVVSVRYIDRPLAEFLEAHFRHTEYWALLNSLLAPFVLVVVSALLFLFLAGCWLLSGRRWKPYIHNHLYGFRFLHGSEHWSSFPSGTASVATALAATVWLLLPRVRVPGILVAGTLGLAMVVANYHWLSDVPAGAFLGTSIGCMSTLLVHPPLPTQNGKP